MSFEIERKFLVINAGWRDYIEAETRLIQGYLTASGPVTVRVRLDATQAYLTLKSATTGISRREFEYPIPFADAETLLRELAVLPLIEKTRYRVRHGRHLWDLDVFVGENAGLVLAELELEHVAETFERPAWLGAEVSADPRYFNSQLAQHPYCRWEQSEQS